jgi:hypothetical protein
MESNGIEPKKERNKKAEPMKKPEQLVYVGPNIRGGRLAQYTVFRGGLPAHIEALLADHPHMRSLIVPIWELAAAKARSVTPGTIEYRAAENLRGGA